MNDPLNPPASLLVKLGSIAVHAEEMISPNGHTFDRVVLEELLKDTEVMLWRARMDALGMLPAKR